MISSYWVASTALSVTKQSTQEMQDVPTLRPPSYETLTRDPYQ